MLVAGARRHRASPSSTCCCTLGAHGDRRRRRPGRSWTDLARPSGGRRTRELAALPDGYDLVVTSPGFRADRRWRCRGRARRRCRSWGEPELAWWLGEARRSAGRPAALARGHRHQRQDHHHVDAATRSCARRGDDAVACGNIGCPVVDALRPGHRVLAVELSSFQLHWSPSVRPVAGAVLNVAEDHLDWHGSMAAYAAAKARVLRGDVAVAGLDDPRGRRAADRRAGAAPGRLHAAASPARASSGSSTGTLVDRAFGDGRGPAPRSPTSTPRRPARRAERPGRRRAGPRARGGARGASPPGCARFAPGPHRGAVVAEARRRP